MDQELLGQLNVEANSVNAGFGSDEYFAARFDNDNRRHMIWAILALKSVIENIPLTVSDPGVARLKLAWWRNQTLETNAHPLYRIAKSLSVDDELLETSIAQLVTSLDQHYNQHMFESEAERKRWFYGCYQSIYRMLIADQQNDAYDDLCEPVESARSLLRLKDELNRQYIRVPKDIFRGENVEVSTILADPDSDSLRRLINTQLNAANKSLDAAISKCSGAPNTALTYALLTKRQLEETIADGGQLLARKIELTPLRKLWIAWRNS